MYTYYKEKASSRKLLLCCMYFSF